MFENISCKLPPVPVFRNDLELINLQSVYFSIIVIIEFFVLIASAVWIITALLVSRKTHQLHLNNRRIIANTLWQYIFCHVAIRIIEILLMYYYFFRCSKEDVTELTNYIGIKDKPIIYCTPFYWLNVIRTYFVFVGAYTLPACVAERMCATIFVTDYEENTRPYISLMLSVFISLLAALFTATFLLAWIKDYMIIVIVVVINGIALIASFYSNYRNIRFYTQSITNIYKRDQRIRYSLSERYQCAQNIRIAKILRKLSISAGALNIILAGTFALIIISLNSKEIVPLHINYEMFDFIIPMYASLIPFIVHRESKIFRKEIRKILSSAGGTPVMNFCFRKSKKVVNEHMQKASDVDVQSKSQPPHVLKNVLGVKLNHASPQHETQFYFEQLDRMWK
ncbi:sre G protein-coupled chemoreceptor domain-containing protein [Ditylenchus destructor]|nr:sre G protein-coupled chemoreceptor domain-containing protein [Ditylenchus destructor]